MHTFPTTDSYFGFSPTAVAAGFLSGLVLLILGMTKNHVGAGARCFGVCVFLGLFVGTWAAVAGGLVLAVMLWFEDRLAAYLPKPPAWMTWTPLPFRRQPVSPAPTLASAVGSRAGEAEEVGHCDSCSKGFALKNGAFPPWCPNCGADIKKQGPPIPPVAAIPSDPHRANEPVGKVEVA
jgi:hypothetical protein